MKFELIKPIESKTEIDRIYQTVFKVVKGHLQPDKITIIKQKDWVFVPVESAGHFTTEEMESLASVVSKRQYKEIIAVLFEKLKIFPSVLKFSVNIDEIFEFDFQCGSLWFVLYSGKPDWIFLCSPEDFFIVGADRQFIEEFLNSTVEKLFNDFIEFIDSRPKDEEQFNRYLRSIYNLLLYQYPKLKNGEELVIP
ncbi:MAG: hypothetical protein J7641_18400 [Cyanobacteria bacterium SID2]|nr:hypothetical protein [Cyanobacteria bacterium SID2]MBP0002664.1 hypothetical protein [Cyanobacteria bacterium SBC]